MTEKAKNTGKVRTAQEGLPEEVDVIVVGSGAAGMMAALRAANAGAEVLLLESQPQVGGTTAISGGANWVPNHGFSTKALRAVDSPELARTYLLGEGRDQTLDHDQVDTYIEMSPKVARYIEDQTYLSWIPVLWPDYTSDIPGASTTRALFPGPFPPETLGDQAKYVRPPKKSGMAKNPLPLWMINKIKKAWVAGYAMAGAFLEACLREGVDVRVSSPVVALAQDEKGVSGVVVETSGGQHQVRARGGVVLATGGFEGSADMSQEFIGAPFEIQVSPKGHEGIAVRLAQQVGAEMTAMGEAWWMPASQLPGEVMDDQPISRLLQGERALPHGIMVNRQGKRFGNEASSYNHLGAVMSASDESGAKPNAKAWLVFDHTYWTRFGIFGTPPGGKVPDYITQADSLEELARKCGIDADGLVQTVQEFNPEARKGRDPWFNRGGTLFERFFGNYNPRMGENSPDARFPAGTIKARMAFATAVGPVLGPMASRSAMHRNPERMRSIVVPVLAKIMRPSLESPPTSVLGPVETAPFYAVEVNASSIGTLGGPKTDTSGRVLAPSGEPIPGLYAAGNAGGAVTKGFYGGAGGTIGLGLVFGYLAGEHAAGRRNN